MTDVYLHLFHGRNSPDEELEDWGFDGPVLGPFRYVHITYMSDIKFEMEREAFKVAFPEVFADWEGQGVSNGDGYPTTNDGRMWIEHHLSITEDLITHGGKFYGDFSIATSHEQAKDFNYDPSV